MKEMDEEQGRKNPGRARTQHCLHENKDESLRPQPLGCRKTIIIRREMESVQVATLAGGLWNGFGGLHLNQDGIKRGGVAQIGKFF